MLWTKLTDEELIKTFAEPLEKFDSKGYWMVLWIGKIVTRMDRNIYVEFSLIRIVESNLTEFDFSKLDKRQIRTFQIHIRLIPMLRPGTIFKEGKIILGKQYEYFRPTLVEIDTRNNSSQLIGNCELGQAFKKSIGLHNNDALYQIRNDFANRCNVWVLDNIDPTIDADLIVYPSYEIMRFSLFRSSRMVQALVDPFSFSNKHNNLYDPDTLKLPSPEQPWHQITLRDEMHTTDAAFIARDAFDIIARKAARKIYQSFFNDESKLRGEFYLDAEFPFKDKVKQLVNGFMLNVNGIKIFFVLEIIQCHSSFPFNSLRFKRESDDSKTDKDKPPVPGKTYNPEDKKNKNPKEKSPKIRYKYHPEFDYDPTNNSKIKNNQRFTKALYVEKKRVRFPNLTRDIKPLRIAKTVPPKIDNQQIQTLPTVNISANNFKASNTDSAGFELSLKEPKEVEEYTVGNYADLFRLIVG